MFKSPVSLSTKQLQTGYKSSLYNYYAKPGQIPQYGVTFQVKLESKSPVCPGGGGGGDSA